MRLPLVFALFAAASLGRPDRLITVPTARKLLDGSFRAESLRRLGMGERGIDYFALGFGGSWEGEARILRDGAAPRLTGDLTYNVIAPLPDFSPGFAVGLQDLGDETRAGLRGFLCGTIRNGFARGNVPFDVTAGLTLGRRVRPYVGTSVPIYGWLRLLAEHDGYVGQGALEATPIRGLRLRLVGRPGAVLASIGYTVRL